MMDIKLDPSRDDLPLMANTNHILVKHYVLDLDIDFECQVIEGTIVLFFEDGDRLKQWSSSSKETCQMESNEACTLRTLKPCHIPATNASSSSSKMGYNNFEICSKADKDISDKDGNHDNQEQASGISISKYCCDTENHGREEFLLVLDCCDLSVLKVEEVDVAAVLGIEKFTRSPKLTAISKELRNEMVRELVTLPADRWREQFDYFARCSQAPSCGELFFDTDTWSLRIRKTGAQTATDFPHAIRIWYKTKPEGRSVTWTSDQCGRYVDVCSHMDYPCRFQSASASTQEIIPHRVFAPLCLKDVCQGTLLPLIPLCLSAAHSVLGTHPFSRLDILIIPANFPSLGMASPHIIFLSQSTLTGMSHLCGTRLCHEIAHAWFGLAIGAQDWTEEWLSEGFATHLEDVIWAEAQQLSVYEAHEHQELRACLRWHRLQDELQNSLEEMQVLRPRKEKTGHVSDSGASVVKHGLNPEKTFMQVHYLKGYFLLRFLARTLGDETYFSFLRKFVHMFHGQLILSQNFLEMLLENIPEEKRQELSVENIFRDWLESSGIPKPLQTDRQAGAECRLVRQVDAEVTKWIQVNRRPRKRKRGEQEEVFEKLLPDQLILLLEQLLQEKTLNLRTLQSLQRTYSLHKHDAEVRHRWCELVIKHKYSKAYKHVERFLQEDQAMGVYLYGELMVSENAQQQQLAHRCFALTKEQMDRSSAQVVAEMLF
ncbi:aminopeptidase O isoform X9 [Perognathus longimembris pacificus]|uniref:aminopeptidase O isoform X9 n=1 Tax=Perognathus longimembris pacificus TaxID=214514 RepID=UPI0020194D1E|nr:aminopeptidase O isoform X9 [Perognathus longimembris pacificus]